MNFMNRKMFQVGGDVSNLGPNQILDTKTGKIYNVSPEKITQLGLRRGLNIYPIYNDPSLVKGSNVAKILEDFVQEDAPFAKDFPNLQRPGEATDVGAGLQELARRTTNVLGPIGLGAMDIINEFTGKGIEKSFEAGVNQFLPGSEMDGRQFIRETFSQQFQPITKEDVSRQKLLNIATGVEDFSQEISEIEDAPKPTNVSAPSTVQDTNILDDDLPNTMTDSETLGVPSDALEMAERKRNYEASLIGRDEFGNIIERPDEVELPPALADQIDKDLAEITPIESIVDVDKTEAESKAENLIKFDPPSKDLELADLGMTEEEFNRARAPEVIKEDTGIFGSDRFLDFVRNVGGELVATGQIGEGLASGAAKAASERAARDLLEEEADRELDKAKKLADYQAGIDALAGMDYKEAKALGEAEESIGQNLADFQKSERTLRDLDAVFKDLEDPNAYGVKGWLQESMTKLAAAAGMPVGDWKKLDPTTRINSTLEVLTQASVRDILGESGKTISNLDRQIVADIFGNLTVFTDPSVIKNKLRRTRTTTVESMQRTQGELIRNLSYFTRTGETSPLVVSRKNIIDKILGLDLAQIRVIGSYLNEGVNTESIIDAPLA
tara:strand:- start:959 stop:2794 length:1836 start_codon:yes stop_codon:yes gene_type:complete